ARVRHAREFEFALYEKYKDFYFEQRFSGLKIIDEVAKGGGQITFQLTTLDRLSSAEMRFFHLNKNVYAANLSDFAGQTSVKLISNTASVRFPGEREYVYEAIISRHALFNRNLQIGDIIEFEHSLFLSNPRNGTQKNYYGTTFLYKVGLGLVPWYAPTLENGTGSGDTSAELPSIAWMGGTTTLHTDYSAGATEQFKQMSSVLSMENANAFLVGRRLHHTDWGTGQHSEPNNPAVPIHSGKVGPNYNTASCVSCHDKNGVSVLPGIGQPLINHVVMIGSDAEGTPHPRWGEQLSPRATSGDPEGQVLLQGYETITGNYGDGSPFTLRKPLYEFVGEDAPEFFSVRAAQKLVALGLREAVAEETILALADPDDLDGDGISGRALVVEDPNDPSKKFLGRFGRKGSQPSVQHQIAYAFNRDMGVTTDLMPVLDGDTTPSPIDLSAPELTQLTRYIQLLGTPPARKSANAQVIRGRQLFAQLSCNACHTPEMTTSRNHPVASLRNQLFRPYSDGLLHDMGPGLADNMDGEGATAAEWLTAPLVGIGLVAAAAGEESYLHDGRARTIEEAILWHGGEAEQAKEDFRTLPVADRSALIKFIQSL
ncbi:MAG: di-heme oxidoredictase family protein, partial [Pirellulales bacterium]